MYIKNKKQVKL